MPKFQLADTDTKSLAKDILERFSDAHDGSYNEILASRVKIDILFAYGDRDENGMLVGDAITKNGVKALGQCSIVNLRNRAAGRGDVEILLDGDFWETAGDGTRFALLDHELFHIQFKRDKDGSIKRDDLSRPMIRLRAHDFEVGWFATIAARNGMDSIERRQAKQMLDEHGQAFFGDIMDFAAGTLSKSAKKLVETVRKAGGSMTISHEGKSVEIK